MSVQEDPADYDTDLDEECRFVTRDRGSSMNKRP